MPYTTSTSTRIFLTTSAIAFATAWPGWTLPIQVGLEEHQVLSRNGVATPQDEAAREDVVTLAPGESVKTFRRFRDFVGRYVTRSNNAVLGDHGALFQWKVVP